MTARRPWPLRIYATLTALFAPFAAAALRSRVRRGKEDGARLGERFGRASLPRPDGVVVWMHGASVGESLSLLTLVDQVQRAHPDFTVLVTSGTRASAALLTQRLRGRACHQYAPIDTPAATAAFLRHWRPRAGILTENELWPNLVLGARAAGVRLALFSARFSRRSLAGWSRAPRSARALLGAFDLLLARDAEAAAGFARLGVTVHGLADGKFGAAALPVDAAELALWRDRLGARPLLLAASTHEGEDGAILDAFERLAADHPQALLVIAPRHVERGEAVEALARARGLRTARRSRGADPMAAQVYVADTIGEMGLWYRLARVAFVGGSLVAGVGGHNPLEPARLGRPIVTGPFTENWPVWRRLLDADAARLCADGESLHAAFLLALQDAHGFVEMAGRASRLVAEGDAGAAAGIARILDLVEA